MQMALSRIGADETSAYGRLRTLILTGQLRRGQPLIERVLADRLGFSRTPVREAMRRLEVEGLVRIVEGKGAFVPSYTIEDIQEIYQVREGLEPLAARIGCSKIPATHLDHFDEELSRYLGNTSLREEQPEAWQQLGQRFHDMFIYASANERLIQTLESMRNQIELFRALGTTFKLPADAASALEEHIGILRALQARDAALAEKRVRDHLQSALHHRLAAFRTSL
jgi:DNA-binding GntR family transcriptional regulator